MKTINLLLIPVILIAAAGSATFAQQEDAPDGQSFHEEGAVIEKLKEIVTLREMLLDAQTARTEAARISETKLAAYEIALIESEIDLAKAEGRKDALDEHLQDLVDVFKRKVASIQRRAGVNRVSSEDVAKAQISLFEAEIRLLRALGQ